MPQWLKLLLTPLSLLWRRTLLPADVAIIESYRDEVAQLRERLERCEQRHSQRDESDRLLREEVSKLRDYILQVQRAHLKGLITIDQQFLIIDANEDAAMICETTVAKLVGQPIHRLIPHRFRDHHHKMLIQSLDPVFQLRKTPLDTFILTFAGHEAPVTIEEISKWGMGDQLQQTAKFHRR